MTKKQKRKFLKNLKAIPNVVFKLFVIVIFFFPFYWMITTAFKTYGESIQFPPTLWPQNFTLNSFRAVFESINVGMYIKNTIIVTMTTLMLQLLINVPAAYGFAKRDFKGKSVFWAILMSTMMIPGQLTFTTIYYLFARSGLTHTYWPQIIPGIGSSFMVFLLRQNFKQVPEELIESAKMDNASEWKIIWKIMVPMAKSSLVTCMLLNFIGGWNAYFWPLVITREEKIRPIATAIERLKGLEGGLNYPTIMAGCLILIAPIIILFLVGSKKIIQSMAYRGMK